LIFDSSGALYGTTAVGGSYGYGTVYKLTPPAAGGTLWTETVLYSFKRATDGGNPQSGLILDGNGALYGTGYSGGSGYGTVYKLAPPADGGTPWTLTVLYNFSGGTDGGLPYSAPIFDRHGALYGTTRAGGANFGMVYKLTPPATGGTPWMETILHSFTNGADGGDPFSGLTFDRHGALYGTTREAGLGYGTAYKLMPPAKAQTPWTLTVLHSFTGGTDGADPYADMVLDRNGALYGTSSGEGSPGFGTVFEIR
jgi:uncharacterized repeat protein (TIGR03803 family)